MSSDDSKKPESIPVYRSGGNVPAAWLCGICEWSAKLRDDADRCCTCATCQKPMEWNAGPRTDVYMRSDICASCRRPRETYEQVMARHRAKDLEESEAAKNRIDASSWAGWVWSVELDDAGEGTGYASSVSRLIERCVDKGIKLPAYAWTCFTFGLKLDASDIVERACEDGEHHEDAYDTISGDAIRMLQDYMDMWVKRPDVNVKTYQRDERTIILFGAAEQAEYNRRKAEREQVLKDLGDDALGG